MRRLKGRRPSPAMTVAGAALVIALAGTAMAAPTAIKSVLDKQEKKQVKKIAKNQAKKALPIGGGELGNVNERTQTTTIAQNTNGTAQVACSSGERVISGGWRDNAPPTNTDLLVVFEDHRTGNGWRASGRAFGTNRTITVFAYCLAP